MIHGLDLSSYQPRIDWPAVLADPLEVRFVYVKFTEGNGWVSKVADGQWTSAGRYHGRLLRGPYHFCRWDSPGDPVLDARDEAEHFYGEVGPLLPGDLPPVADVEWITGERRDPDELVAWVLAFRARAQQLFDRELMIYTGPSFWKFCLLPDKRDLSLDLAVSPLWEADYNSPPGQPKRLAGVDWPWTIHQYSGHGRVRGVMDRFGKLTDVDLNVFRGSFLELRALASQAV